MVPFGHDYLNRIRKHFLPSALEMERIVAFAEDAKERKISK
jgi:hypothetical protein